MSRPVLIQPRVAQLAAYRDLAARRDWSFEVIELGYPDAFGPGREAAVAAYRPVAAACLAVHGAYIDIVVHSPDELLRSASWQRIDESLDAATVLGATYCIFHSNRIPQINDAGYEDLWVEASATCWRTMLERHPMTTIVIENMWDRDPSSLRALCDVVASHRFGICIDVAHLNIHSQAPLATWFDELGDRVRYVQLGDNRGVVDDDLPLGDGDVPWPDIDAVLTRLPDVPVMLGVGTRGIDALERSIGFLAARTGVLPLGEAALR